jgi:DNA polymerase/3'-5' exonuclease PolX
VKESRLNGFVKYWDAYKVNKGDINEGKYVQLQHPSGINVDVFIANPDNYGMVVFTRTGPSEVSKFIIGVYMKSKGLCSKDSHLQVISSGRIISVRSEKEFFCEVGMSYRRPEDRTLDRYPVLKSYQKRRLFSSSVSENIGNIEY